MLGIHKGGLAHGVSQWSLSLFSRGTYASSLGKEILELVFAFIFIRKKLILLIFNIWIDNSTCS